jgi:hypothetical protein
MIHEKSGTLKSLATAPLREGETCGLLLPGQQLSVSAIWGWLVKGSQISLAPKYGSCPLSALSPAPIGRHESWTSQLTMRIVLKNHILDT